jgi:ssDNA-binding Zn-finger/Zn-ribbon topoisomerase 1
VGGTRQTYNHFSTDSLEVSSMTEDLVECPKCQVKVSIRNLKRHLKRNHNPEIEKARAEERASKLKIKINEERMVSCPICKCSVQSKNLTKHGRVKHGLYPSQMASECKTLSNKFKSNRERELFWNKMCGPETEEPSNDIFSKNVVLNGGAYGLGKSRKH